ncbi:hypothetical protein N2152v2_010684 [Parachlorella kessleri]
MATEELDDRRHAARLALERHAYETAGGQLHINYDDFSQASVFLRLARDENGGVPLPSLFQYLAARSRQLHLRTQLGLLDDASTSLLGMHQLHQFLQQLCLEDALRAAGVALRDWALVAAQRVWLLHGKRNRLAIRDLVASPLLDELLRTVQLLADTHGKGGGSRRSTDGSGPSAAPLLGGVHGWFAPANVARLRRGFAELDLDGDGLLSQEDFARFSEGTMTSFFIQRLFSQHCSSNSSNQSGSSRAGPPAMDFPAFLDIYTLFKEVFQLWVDLGQYTGTWPCCCAARASTLLPAGKAHEVMHEIYLRPEDVVAEVTDLLRPGNPTRITVADFQHSRAAGTVIGVLADVNLFWEYENREALAQQAQEQEGA